MSRLKTEARFTICPALDSDLPDVIRLFTLYAESLHIDLTFQSFAEELAGLPGKYAPPTGQILLAKEDRRIDLVPVASPAREFSLSQNDFAANGDKGEASRESEPTSTELVNNKAVGIGCVAVRPIRFYAPYNLGKENAKACEMKRLYTTPAARGLGVGKALIEEILHVAENLGYEEMYLDTLSTMTTALGMYEKFGFERTDPYYHNPHEGVVFLVKRLGKAGGTK